MKKIYSILGDFYHSHDFILPALTRAASGIPGTELIDCKLADISQVLDKKPDVLVMACENRLNPQDENINFWLTPELDSKIEAYVAGGGSLIAIHSALASYPPTSKYRAVIKGSFIHHPQKHYNVRYTSGDNSPLGGTAFDYAVLDEFYELEVDTADTNVFMHSSCDYGQGYGGWWHSYSAGKVMVLVPTHNEAGFGHAETIRLYKEGLEWAL